MKKIAAVTVLVGSMFLVSGCAALVGGAVGAGGTATGYEVHLDNERDRVQKLYDEGKIDKREYEIRVDQIRRDSAVQ
ncbi:MAG: hypothetical protein Tsb0032_28770 [Kiloniellaceae bacterium]